MKLTPAAASDKSQIVELGHLVLHDGCAVAQLGAVVLIVASANRDHGAVHDVAQGDDLEGHRQCLIGAPVRWQDGADEERAACSY